MECWKFNVVKIFISYFRIYSIHSLVRKKTKSRRDAKNYYFNQYYFLALKYDDFLQSLILVPMNISQINAAQIKKNFI